MKSLFPVIKRFRYFGSEKSKQEFSEEGFVYYPPNTPSEQLRKKKVISLYIEYKIWINIPLQKFYIISLYL